MRTISLGRMRAELARSAIVLLVASLLNLGDGVLFDVHADETHVIEIITEIRNVSVLSFQVGEKSRQRVEMNVTNGDVKTSFDTGKTSIVGFDVASIRNDFKVSGVSLAGGILSLTATGQTASRVGILPDIDYTFAFKLNKSKRELWVSGCHNEFPSYRILVDGKTLYDREQTGTALIGLLGKCDIVVNVDGQAF